MTFPRSVFPGLVLAIVCTILGCSGGATDDPGNDKPIQPDPTEIRKLISEAAGSPANELPGFAKPGRAPSLESVKKESLTVAVLLLSFTPETTDENHRNEFRLIGADLPDPGKIADACAKSEESGFYSVIQPEYITDFSCEFDGDSAKGHVSFEAAGVYAARVLFKASRNGNAWRIVEFQMPAWDVTTRINDNGKWKLSGSGAILPSR